MKSSRSILIMLILTAVLLSLAVGCASDQTEQEQNPPSGQEAENSPKGAESASLIGTSWILESLGEGEGQIPALEDQQPTLGFLPDRYGGDSGCNFYAGVYNSDGSNLVMETPASTGGVCSEPEDVQKQESVYMSSLATVTSHAVGDDKLKMYSSSDQLMLTMRAMAPVPLQATLWSLQFVNVETQWQPILPGTDITMKIDGDELSGSAGCNDYMASVSEKAGALTISEISATNKICNAPAGVMEQETLYLSMLEQVALLRQFPVSQQLLDVDGAPLLLYSAAD